MKQEHEPWDFKTYHVGADTSTEKEFLGSVDGSGKYIILHNGRPTSEEGNNGAAEKIKGEQLLYQRNVVGSYECIGTSVINGHIIEFWAPIAINLDPFIRIDGIIVAKSPLMKMRVDFPLQIDKNENNNGGEAFVTDRNTPPFILNIKDLIDSLTSNPNKYFSAYDPLLYEVNLSTPLDIPVFVDLVNVGGGGGLPPGDYQYEMRYASVEGDRTHFSVATPLIPVVQNFSSESDQYPFAKTRGGPANPSFGTRYAIHLRFRVTNIFNYDYIEIKRVSHNTGAGIGYVPASKIVAKIDIGPGEISVREYLDPEESNVDAVLSAATDTEEIAFIENAKTIRYFDRRTNLMNVKLASKEAALTFKTYNNKVAFPVMEKLGKAGYNDPYNHTYKKKYLGNERYGFGIELFDGVGGKGYVTKVPGFTDYQFPSRREVIDADSQLFSYGGTVKAATITNTVDQTFEVFDLVDAIAKTDKCSFKNIYRDGGLELTGLKSKAKVTEDCDEENGEIENHGAHVSLINEVYPYWHPYTPVKQSDPDVTGHNYIVNTQVSPTNSESDGVDYRPKAFGPNYFSTGMLIAGVDNIPPWAKAFSVVRTDSAKRVVAQGLGMYHINPAIFKLVGNTKLGTKEKDRFWFFSPDIENGVVSSGLVNDIIENPQNYQVQFVSPLGFFSEMYSFENNTFEEQRDRLIDMISYARIIRDTNTSQINPGEDPNMGIDGADGYRYVGYGKYRNTGQQPATFNAAPFGNTLFNLESVERIVEGRGEYMGIQITQDLYGTNSTGGSSDDEFGSQGLKDWTEPFYIVNIIRSGAVIRDQNVQKYKSTGHYQKLESIIGQGTGLANQKYILVDERWEDCIPALTSSDPRASIDRYLYIKRNNTNIVEKWMDITYKNPAQKAIILSDITTFGFYGPNVKGVYTHENIENKNRFFNIIFSQVGYYPQAGDKIIVRYDSDAPIRVFGGDAIIGETLFAPVDRSADAHDKAAHTQFALGVGFPFHHIKLNPRHYVVTRTTGVNRIQDVSWAHLGYLRQLCVMFPCESRISLPYSHDADYPLQFFPSINYVMRPNRWEVAMLTTDQNIYPEYAEAYGENERTQWKWGGFRFLQQINPDYSNQSANEYFSKPAFGFTEKVDFYTRCMWSLARAINVQDAPGLRTFPANNSFDIDDNQGEIKFAYSATTDRGENLYAITNKGICLLVTKKSILSDLNAGELGYMAADLFIKQQYWLTKDTGMTDEFWRSAVCAYVPITVEGGAEILKEALFFANHESVFRFMDNNLVDIGRIDFHNEIFPVLDNVRAGYGTHLTAIYDRKNKEYWLHINTCRPTYTITGGGAIPRVYHPSIPDDPCLIKTYVFGQKNGRWHGTNDYRADRFASRVGTDETFILKNVECWSTGVGYVVNGGPVIFQAWQASSMLKETEKEFIRVRINTGANVKPTRIEFLDQYNGTQLCFLDPSQGPLYLKRYDGWEQFIPRKDASVSPARDRVQSRLLVYKIIHNLPSEFRVISSGIQYKPIK